MDPTEVPPGSPPHPRASNPGSNSLSAFFGGWIGFSLWVSLFLIWLGYLSWQVIKYRPQAPGESSQKIMLPSRAQLSLAEGIWLVEMNSEGKQKVLEGIAGVQPPNEAKGNADQLPISQLNEAIGIYLGTDSDKPSAGIWLVPISKNAEPLEKPGNKAPLPTNPRWKVAPLPPDLLRMHGGPGAVFPDTPFNRSLMTDWWGKREKTKVLPG